MNSRFNKWRQISFDELRVRGTQALAAFAERRAWSSHARLVSDQAFLDSLDPLRCDHQITSAAQFLDYFRVRSKPGFFIAFSNREETLKEFRHRWPSSEQEIIGQANRILEGRFDLLGLRDLSFGDPVDWHLEPVTGKRVPLVHWSRIDYLDAELTGDKKIIWELNRHQYFITLGQAYWLTADERYAEAFVSHLSSWMDQNPPKLGINWASSLEIALRSISWLWALHFFRHTDALRPQVFVRMFKFLYLSASHLGTYLSTYFSPNTHLTGEALGLFYLGTLLPEFKEALRWRNTGLHILLTQLSRHVKADGVYFEQSSYYHRYTTDFYTHLLILLCLNGEPVPPELEEKLKLLLDHLMYITRPDGSTPLFGDDDGGRLVTFDRRLANDFRGALATGAALFGREDYKYVAGEPAEETLWLLGLEGLHAFDRVKSQEPSLRSRAFAEGGYYVMRDGWTPSSNYLLFDCGSHGVGNCGHAHADALAFELAVHGRPMLVDPGTFTYTGCRETRDWFRSSAAHNTMTIDGESSSMPGGPFSWRSIAQCELRNWITVERFDYIEAHHDGYERLANPANHSRSILFLKNDYWVVRDFVSSRGQHLLNLWFHFDSGINPFLERKNNVQVVKENGGSVGLHIATFANGGGWSKEAASVSHCYGEKVEAPVFRFTAEAEGTEELVTFMLPQVGSSSITAVEETQATGGRAFVLAGKSIQDIVMLSKLNGERVGSGVETAQLASDFAWTWARFARGEDLPEQFVVICGHTLKIKGTEILRSARRISYLAASRVDGQFRLETENGISYCQLPILS